MNYIIISCIVIFVVLAVLFAIAYRNADDNKGKVSEYEHAEFLMYLRELDKKKDKKKNKK